jgi:hypothetical protein
LFAFSETEFDGKATAYKPQRNTAKREDFTDADDSADILNTGTGKSTSIPPLAV